MNASLKRILLVEDDPSDVMLMREALKDTEALVELTVAGDGEEALSRLRGEGRFRLVLLDWRLPKIGGEEVLREIRGDAALKMIPVIVLTTSASEADVRAAYELGANAFLTKPTGLRDLRSLVSSISGFWLTHAVLPPESAPVAFQRRR